MLVHLAQVNLFIASLEIMLFALCILISDCQQTELFVLDYQIISDNLNVIKIIAGNLNLIKLCVAM